MKAVSLGGRQAAAARERGSKKEEIEKERGGLGKGASSDAKASGNDPGPSHRVPGSAARAQAAADAAGPANAVPEAEKKQEVYPTIIDLEAEDAAKFGVGTFTLIELLAEKYKLWEKMAPKVYRLKHGGFLIFAKKDITESLKIWHAKDPSMLGPSAKIAPPIKNADGERPGEANKVILSVDRTWNEEALKKLALFMGATKVDRFIHKDTGKPMYLCAAYLPSREKKDELLAIGEVIFKAMVIPVKKPHGVEEKKERKQEKVKPGSRSHARSGVHRAPATASAMVQQPPVNTLPMSQALEALAEVTTAVGTLADTEAPTKEQMKAFQKQMLVAIARAVAALARYGSSSAPAPQAAPPSSWFAAATGSAASAAAASDAASAAAAATGSAATSSALKRQRPAGTSPPSALPLPLPAAAASSDSDHPRADQAYDFTADEEMRARGRAGDHQAEERQGVEDDDDL